MTVQFQALQQRSGDECGLRHHFLGVPFDRIDQDGVIGLLRGVPTGGRFRYVVTPNVDHVVRIKHNKSLLPYYNDAWLSVCDSSPILALARLLGLRLPLVTGSDLTERIFKSVVQPGDQITIVAPNAEIVGEMQQAYPGVEFQAIVPPYGLLNKPDAQQECVDFVASHEARFVFLAIGSPQSEKIAHSLANDSRATGVALCIGASLEFLLHKKKRAPRWMRSFGVEWVHRLVSEPRRLWRRYSYAVVPLLKLFAAELFLRGRRVN
jgi:exopolysaccharide biosynthesis WecB/TagA/CpsF family protein